MIRAILNAIIRLFGLKKPVDVSIAAPLEKKKKELEAEIKIIKKDIQENRKKAVSDKEIEDMFNGDKK